MEIIQRRYYSDTTFRDTFRAILIEVEKYLAAVLFDGDLSRVLYASPEMCYYRRAGYESYTIDALRLPFCSYFRGNDFMQLDDEPFKKNIPFMLNEGVHFPYDYKNMKIKILPVRGDLAFIVHWGRDDDATESFERLMWMKENFRRTFVYKILYDGEIGEFPVSFVIKDLSFEANEKEWLSKKRIILIRGTLEWRSFLVRPAVGSSSIVSLSEEVILEFLSAKSLDQISLTGDVSLIVSEYFSDEVLYRIPETSVLVSNVGSYDATISFSLERVGGTVPAITMSGKILIDNGREVSFNPTEGTNTVVIDNLQPESEYTGKIRVIYNFRYYTEVPFSFRTGDAPPREKKSPLKGLPDTIVGLEF